MSQAPVSNVFDDLISEAEKLCERRNNSALAAIEKATAAAAPDDARQQALLSYIRSFYDCFVLNKYDAAIERLSRTLAGMNDEQRHAVGHKLLMTLGNSQQLKGDLFSAQESYMNGLKLLDQKASLTPSEKLFFASFYYNLSTLLSSSELKIESEDYLNKAIEIYTALDKKAKLAHCFVAFAQIYERKRDNDRAIEYLNKALDISQALNDAYTIALAKANLGVLLTKIGQHQQALEHLNTALGFYEKSNMVYEAGMVNLELGMAYHHIGELKKAVDFISKAEGLMLQLDNKKELSNIYRAKARVLSASGQFEEANQYLEKHIESLRMFFDTEKTNALARARNEFEFEQREKEARLLREKNREIQEYAFKLEVSNRELDQFASVASHDLKEPLRMISSYMNLLRKSLEGKTTDTQAEFFGYALDGAKRMDQMIQDLLRLAKVGANPRIESVKLMNVIEEVKLNLRNLLEDRKAVIEVGTLPVMMADRTQMVQLFQNLVANGINYNNHPRPVVRIDCQQTSDQFLIRVADNGVGIPDYFKEAAFNIFKTIPNKTQQKGSGIGLSVCKKIVEKMGGKIHIESSREDQGTVFLISLSATLLAPAFTKPVHDEYLQHHLY